MRLKFPKILLSISFGLFLIMMFGFINNIEAAEFDIKIDREFTIEEEENVKVVEIHTITNNTTSKLISADNEEIFQVTAISGKEETLDETMLSVTAFVDNIITQFTVEHYTDRYDIKVPYTKTVGVGNTIEVKIEYENNGLSLKSGSLLDVYAAGFSEDFIFENDQTNVSIDTRIKTAKALPEINFVVPEPNNKETDDFYNIFEINQESLVGSNIWVQFGRSQYYHFNLLQNAQPTDNMNRGYHNEYKLVIPREIEEGELNQQVYFKSISPEPKQIIEDEEGNIIAYFDILSSEEAVIKVEGYAQVNNLDTQANEGNGGTLDQIDSQLFAKYLSAAPYWEVQDPQILEKADELKGSETNVYKLIETTYSYVVDTIDYSQVKRFGINERQGALNTLNGGAAVCMEYSDLFLTLMRAQGIPARAAFGYGYDARVEDQQDAHQWVEVYVPGLKKWISVDVTWGESGPALIGGDLNHLFTHIAAIEPDVPATIERVSYGDQTELYAPEFEVEVISSLDFTELKTIDDLLEEYPEVEISQLEDLLIRFNVNPGTVDRIESKIAENPNGLVYGGYGLVVLAVFMLIIIVMKIVKRKSGKKNPIPQQQDVSKKSLPNQQSTFDQKLDDNIATKATQNINNETYNELVAEINKRDIPKEKATPQEESISTGVPPTSS